MPRLVFFLTLVIVSLTVSPHGSGANQNPAQVPSASDLAEESRLSGELVEFYKQQKFQDALRVGKQLLLLRERLYGIHHARVANSLSDLAELSLVTGHNAEAEQLYTRVVEILDKQPSADPLLLSVALERLGNLKFAKPDYAGAASLLERALSIRTSNNAREDPALASVLHSLANTYQLLRRFDEAEQLYVRSLTIMESTLGKEHAQTVARMKDYACLKYNRDDFNKPPDPKVEKKPDPNELLRYRAECWLFGFKSDCATQVPRKLNTEGRRLNGKALELPKPNYPMTSRYIRERGRVLVAVVVDGNGNVTQAKTVCGGPPGLKDSAVKSALGAKFSPTIIDGKPIEVEGIITYNFIYR